jgi:hypothetical protein
VKYKEAMELELAHIKEGRRNRGVQGQERQPVVHTERE